MRLIHNSTADGTMSQNTISNQDRIHVDNSISNAETSQITLSIQRITRSKCYMFQSARFKAPMTSLQAETTRVTAIAVVKEKHVAGHRTSQL